MDAARCINNMSHDDPFLIIPQDASGKAILSDFGSITPDRSASETVKSSHPTKLDIAGGTITGPSEGVNGNSPEDCIDCVTAYTNGTVTDSVWLRDLKLVSGAANQQQAITIKGGCSSCVIENCTFEGKFKRAEVVLGDYNIYWPVDKMRGIVLRKLSTTDGKPVRVWCMWSERPTLQGGNVELVYSWIPAYFYKCLFGILRWIRGRES